MILADGGDHLCCRTTAKVLALTTYLIVCMGIFEGHTMPRYEVLTGLPTYGPMALPFSAGGWTGAWGGHSEGLVVKFYPIAKDAWVGNFQPGSGGWQGVVEHPNEQHLIVVSGGQGYVVDPETHQLVSLLPGDIQHVVSLPELGAIVVSDGLSFEAIKSSGVWWRSPRISWDKIRNIKVEGTTLRGEASMPTAGEDQWSPFALDLMTGQCEDGVYEEEMRRAIPVRPSRD